MFIGCDSRREKKILLRSISVMNATRVDVPRFLNWREQVITWSREDHVPAIEYPGRVALVVRPKIANYWLPKTLMDGGSTINIMYLSTYKRLNLPKGLVEPTTCTFHGIVPGRKAYPLGKVALRVTFGSPSNFRTEKIQFEQVDFNSLRVQCNEDPGP